MKTHELAKALTTLSNLLRSAPDQELDGVRLGLRRPRPDAASIPMALSTLVALSRFDKAQWLEIIEQYKFPIDVRPRDASRDILGKLLNHLEQNPESRNRLTVDAQQNRSETSPELMKALQLLLKT
jgi:hypothetical protein